MYILRYESIEQCGHSDLKQLINKYPQYDNYDVRLMIPSDDQSNFIDLKWSGQAKNIIQYYGAWIVNHVDETEKVIWVME